MRLRSTPVGAEQMSTGHFAPSRSVLFHRIEVSYEIKKCPEPESNQRHEDFQSSALPTELSGHSMYKLRGPDLNQRPSGYEPDELPDCSTPRYYLNGGRRIRTFEGVANRFTVCPLWPLGNPTITIYIKHLSLPAYAGNSRCGSR